MRPLLDTNAVLRYVLNDVPDQSEEVRLVVTRGADTTPEALCECVYVLTGSYYAFPRADVSRALSLALEDIGCEHLHTMRKALDLFATNNLDFVDCIFAARADVEHVRVLTFDKRLRRLLEDLG